MQLHLFTFFKWMKLLTCWHIGESKNVPFKVILTTISAWMAVELAPLCSRVDFQEKCLCGNEGFQKPYYWVTQKKLFSLHFKFPTEISSQGHETKSTGTKWNGSTAALPFQASQRLLLHQLNHLLLNFWLWWRKIRKSFFFFFFFLAVLGLSCSMWNLVPWPGINLDLLHWGCRVLAAGPPGKF